MAFVHLHVHSQYSLLDGTMDPSHVAAAAAKFDMSAVALTDSANLFGAVAFFKKCKDYKIQAIIGAELYVQPEGLPYNDPAREHGGYQILALVENDAGYKNLCALITAGIFEGMSYKPRIDLDQLGRHREGLIVLSGGRKGVFGGSTLRRDPTRARTLTTDLARRLGTDQLFLELQDHGLPDQDRVNDTARALAAELGIPTVVTNAVHYEKPEDSTIHEALNAIALGCSLSEGRRIQSPTDQAYFKSEAELRALFPNDGDALDRTVGIADRCHFKFALDTHHFPAATPPDPDVEGVSPDTDANWAYFYKAFPPPRDFGLPDPAVAIPSRPEGAGNINGYFGWYGRRGLELRLCGLPEVRHADYWSRLDLELRMIIKMGFPAYLLIVAEFINWSKDNGIPVGPGRGSAAGSLVAYAMRITDIDPLQFDLLFERFLNPERVSMPDIDVDFCQDRREEAITHVRKKYGENLVSQIITYGKLKAKAAVRDVARVIDFSFGDTNQLAKLLPTTLNLTLNKALEDVEQLRIQRELDPRVGRAIALALAVEGMCRQTGVHAAGVVIADRPLVEYAPLYRDDPTAIPAVQFDMKSAEAIGLIKFDFLGLKTLDQLRDACIAVERNHGVRVDLSRIPIDDAQTYEILQAGDALGLFQLESSGMRELLTRLRPSCLDDLVALVALYRPGPLKSGMVDDFVDRKHGRKDVVYPHPSLEPILRGTYGTIVYQEQVMQCAQVMAGYSLGEADILRRAMGKKDAGEMASQQSRFVGGCVRNEIDEKLASDIFVLLEKFAEYGFNKSHSAAYGYISYQTAWMKAHYRAEYMAALLTIDSSDTDKVLTYLEDCRKAGLRIEPVCINGSQRQFDAQPPGPGEPRGQSTVVRFGLAAVKGVGDGAIQAILDARRGAGGAFRDAMDFFERVDMRRVNKKVIEALIKAGAFDFSGLPRATLFDGMEKAAAIGQRHQEDQSIGQASLFGSSARNTRPTYQFPTVLEWPLSEKLGYEKETLGLYLTGHPLEALARDVARFANVTLLTLAELDSEAELRLLGLPTDIRVIHTKRGDRMAFVRLEDQFGYIECVFFADSWMRSQKALQEGRPVLVTGKVETRNESLKVRANSAELLVDVRQRTTREVRLMVNLDELTGTRLDRLKTLLVSRHGTCPVRLVLRQPGRYEAEMELSSLSVEPGTELEEGVEQLFGRSDVVSLQ